jgi:predicted N-acetyltransferase YhbS
LEAIYFRNYQPDDLHHVVELWNTSLNFPLQSTLWRANTELLPHFRNEDFIGAWTPDGLLVGFVLTRQFRDATAPSAMLQNVAGMGWLSVLVVAPGWQSKGLGSQLLALGEAQLGEVKQIRLGADLGHFFPGVPELKARTFFEKRGYHFKNSVVYDLARSLRNWVTPPIPPLVQQNQYYYEQGQTGEAAAILSFLQHPENGFSPRWSYYLSYLFGVGYPIENITLLKQADGKIVGFLQTWQAGDFKNRPSMRAPLYWALAEYPTETHGSIGPLGVDSSVRGGGLGLGLVAAGTEFLKQQGATFVTIDWTDLSDFYGRLGYLPWKSYYMATKEIYPNGH